MKYSLIAIGLLSFVSPLLAGFAPVPEPSTFVLLGGGLGAMILVARWNRSRKK